MEKIKQSELIKIVADELGTPQGHVKEILSKTAETIAKYANNGKAVVFPGLGVFKPSSRAARTFKSSLAKGGVVEIPAHRALTFKPSSKVVLDSE